VITIADDAVEVAHAILSQGFSQDVSDDLAVRTHIATSFSKFAVERPVETGPAMTRGSAALSSADIGS
jgi:hypothetical protein